MSILQDRFESASQRLSSRLRQIQLADPSPNVAQQVWPVHTQHHRACDPAREGPLQFVWNLTLHLLSICSQVESVAPPPSSLSSVSRGAGGVAPKTGGAGAPPPLPAPTASSADADPLDDGDDDTNEDADAELFGDARILLTGHRGSLLVRSAAASDDGAPVVAKAKSRDARGWRKMGEAERAETEARLFGSIAAAAQGVRDTHRVLEDEGYVGSMQPAVLVSCVFLVCATDLSSLRDPL